MNQPGLIIRKTFAVIDETRLVVGRSDGGVPLRKVAVCAIIKNPLAGRGFVADLAPLVEVSEELGTWLGTEAVRLLGEPVESYGKGGLAGVDGEQEHINAALTAVFGHAFRDAVGGGKAWITSATKVGVPGVVIDIPLAYKDEIWVRSHYDAVEVRIPDAPQPDELVVIAAVANRGRINARVGGMTIEQAQEKASV